MLTVSSYARLFALCVPATVPWVATPWSAAYAQSSAAARSGSYAPGARSTASMNGTFQSVVGQLPSPTQSLLGQHGTTYRIDAHGQISGPDRRHVAPGCARALSGHPASATAPDGPSTVLSAAPGQAPPQGSAILIGTIPSPDPTIFQTPIVVMNASDGPSGVYVTPGPCTDGRIPSTTSMAASAVAATGGNPFALAGNREGLRDALHAHTDVAGDLDLLP